MLVLVDISLLVSCLPLFFSPTFLLCWPFFYYLNSECWWASGFGSSLPSLLFLHPLIHYYITLNVLYIVNEFQICISSLTSPLISFVNPAAYLTSPLRYLKGKSCLKCVKAFYSLSPHQICSLPKLPHIWKWFHYPSNYSS